MCVHLLDLLFNAPPSLEIFHFHFDEQKIFCLFFRAAPAAYGSSQARGGNGAAAASLHHSHSFNGHHSSRQGWILHLLSEARD